MEPRRESMLCSPRTTADEDEHDFLSRYVNLEWDADGSEWNDYRVEFPDILSNEFFSREHSHEKIFEDVKNSRKSSLEKPVGFLMQLKPHAYVCENFKSSCWGKFLSSERKTRDSRQAYLKEKTDCNKVNIEKTEDKKSAKQCQSVGSGSCCRRSKSVNDVLEDSADELEQKQEQNHSLKQEGKDENACGMTRAAKRLSKQFSVYSQNFDLNTRFLSKSHYHVSHWKPETSRVKTRERLTNTNDPILENDVVENRMAFKKDEHEKPTEVEEIRRKFNTEKYYRSWVWEPEDIPCNKLKIFGKANSRAQNYSSKCSKMYSSTEFANRKTKSQKKSKERKKISGPFRQLSEGNNTSSTISLPAISSQNVSTMNRQRSRHKLGHFPCISNDNLVKQYRKYHDEFINQKNKNNKNKQVYT